MSTTHFNQSIKLVFCMWDVNCNAQEAIRILEVSQLNQLVLCMESGGILDPRTKPGISPSGLTLCLFVKNPSQSGSVLRGF